MATPPRHPGMNSGPNPFMYDARAWMRHTAPPPSHAMPRPGFMPKPVSFIPHVLTSNSRPSTMPALLPQSTIPLSGASFSGMENHHTPNAGLSPHSEPLSLTNKETDHPLDLSLHAKRKLEDDQPLDLSRGPRTSSQPRRKMVATVKPEVTISKLPNMTNKPALNMDTVSGRVSVGSDCEAVGGNSSHPSSTYSLIGDHPVSDILYLFCTRCHSSYGSIHGFRKHFRTTHGYTPSSEDVLIQGIKATKEYFAQQPNAGGPSTSAAGLSSSTAMPRFHCISCGWQCDQRAEGAITQHKATHADSSTTFCCYYCKESYSQQARLMEHLSLKHTNNYQFICSFCKIAFAMGDQLSMHLQAEHGMFLTRPQSMAPMPKSELSSAKFASSVTQSRCERPSSSSSPSNTNSPGSARKESVVTHPAGCFSNAPTLAGVNLMSFLDKVVENGLRNSAVEDAATAMTKVLHQKQSANMKQSSPPRDEKRNEVVESNQQETQLWSTTSQFTPSTTASQPLTMMEKLEIAITRELLADVSDAKSSHLKTTEALYTTAKPIMSQVKVKTKNDDKLAGATDSASRQSEDERKYMKQKTGDEQLKKRYASLPKDGTVDKTGAAVHQENNADMNDEDYDKDGPLQIVEESDSPQPVDADAQRDASV